jgi:hypothetical protein
LICANIFQLLQTQTCIPWQDGKLSFSFPLVQSHSHSRLCQHITVPCNRTQPLRVVGGLCGLFSLLFFVFFLHLVSNLNHMHIFWVRQRWRDGHFPYDVGFFHGLTTRLLPYIDHAQVNYKTTNHHHHPSRRQTMLHSLSSLAIMPTITSPVTGYFSDRCTLSTRLNGKTP